MSETQQVLVIVGQAFDVEAGALTGPRRTANLSNARHAAMWILYEWMGLSLNETGAVLGGRDHSTVLYGKRQASGYLACNPRFRAKMTSIRNDLRPTLKRELPELPPAA